MRGLRHRNKQKTNYGYFRVSADYLKKKSPLQDSVKFADASCPHLLAD